MKFFISHFIRCVVLALTTHACARGADATRWVQIHLAFHYTRTGTIATAPEGNFTFKFDADLDQMMERIGGDNGEGRPEYDVNDDYTPTFKLVGRATMDGSVTQSDANGSYSASAGLASA